MHLTDPSRPRMGDRPTYGQGMAVLPELLVWPQGGGLTRISCFLATAPDRFSRFEALWTTSELPTLLRDYRDDPEGVLGRLYGWTVPTKAPTAKPTKQSTLDLLAALDLED